MPKARRGNLWHPRPTRSPCLCEEPTSPCHCAEPTSSIRRCEEGRVLSRRGKLWYLRRIRGQKREIATHHFVVLAMTECGLSLRGVPQARRSNLWYPGTVRTKIREPQKRDCHAPLRGARNDSTWGSADCHGSQNEPRNDNSQLGGLSLQEFLYPFYLFYLLFELFQSIYRTVAYTPPPLLSSLQTY